MSDYEDHAHPVAQSEHEIKMERCPICRGSGDLWTECCNGSQGCECRGQQVYMGPCRECDGYGEIEAGTWHGYPASRTKQFMQSASQTGFVGNPYGRLR